MSDPETAGFFERLRRAAHDSIAYSRGQLSLKTTTRPAPPPQAGPRQVLRLRKTLRMSQSVFAATLNVSPKTVQSWEQGFRRPADAALRMLQLIRQNPQIVGLIFPVYIASRPQRGASAGTRVREPRKEAV